MCVGREHAAEEVEQEEPQMSEPVFDVVAEYPEIEHVPADMQQSAVHKHGGEYGKHGRYRLVRMETKYVFRNCAEGIHQGLAVS